MKPVTQHLSAEDYLSSGQELDYIIMLTLKLKTE